MTSADPAADSWTPTSPSGVWSRIVQHFAVRSPRINRRLPKLRSGRFLMELGEHAEWKPVHVVLAGETMTDLGLYYFADKGDASPLGCIALHSAHIDSLEEVLMVVAKDKTWFLCAERNRDASDWAAAVCAAIDRVGEDTVVSSSDSTPRSRHRRLSSNACHSPTTLRELQSRGARSRADAFLELFVKSTAPDACLQAVRGALSWSCMRGIAWKVWLDYLPADVPLKDWLPIVRDKRCQYAAKRQRHSALRNNLAGRVDDVDFVASCEVSPDVLLYDIFKDVRRTRGAMVHFRDPHVQALMIRVLYTYSAAHPDISYNQGMSELLAVIVYLLHVEQWPASCDGDRTSDAVDASPSECKRERLRTASAESLDELDAAEASFMYVEAFLGAQDDGAYLDRDALLRLTAFTGGSANYYECCRDAAEEIVRELTLAEFIEHDTYGMLEEMMERMAGTFCPDIVVPVDLSAGTHKLKRKPSRRGRPSGVSQSSELASSPLYDQMNSIHHHILRRCDPPTARHLSQLGVEPQMFLLRWVRVLMAREFELPQVWQIWDAIFSLTPSDFSFINVLCVAVVREYRNDIQAAEDATSVLLALRDVSDRIGADQLVDAARELYDALLIAAALEATAATA